MARYCKASRGLAGPYGERAGGNRPFAHVPDPRSRLCPSLPHGHGPRNDDELFHWLPTPGAHPDAGTLGRYHHATTTYGALSRDPWGRMLVFGRFLPGVRVVVSLLAGSGRMPFGRFTVLNFLGGVPWIGLFVYAGYFFGALAWIHAYLVPGVVLAMLLGFLPLLVRWGRKAWRRSHPGSAQCAV